MKTVVGILCLGVGVLYLGQVISVANFGLAQRFGLQETSDHTDPLFSHLERWAARWDLWWLWTLPAAGVLMLTDHPWWPVAALVGGGAAVDTGGREAAKNIGLRQQGVRTGSPGQRRLAMGTFAYLIVSGGLTTAVGLHNIV